MLIITPLLILFQFHKGTIRTGVHQGRHCNQRDFNSIKVQLGHCQIKSPITLFNYFNSIKVQLELNLIFSILVHLIYFNSIKVQLELDVCCDLTIFDKFQFHKGTIRTNLRSGFSLSSSTDFNSIKVQLEPSVLCYMSDVPGYFNSIKVQLELASRASYHHAYLISIP